MDRRIPLPRAVIALGAVSLFTDLSSEMIYPLLPVFLVGVLGASAVSLGLVEGVAEATASLFKVASGFWSDRVGRRKPLVVAGYGLSGFARPFIGLAWAWPVVLGLRFADRVGKGLRTSPRDALIADVTDPAIRGRAYGWHRAMDHAGAVLGPLAAAGLLAVGLELGEVFLLAAVPALVVMAILVFAVKETRPTARPHQSPVGDLGQLGPAYRRLLLAVLVFTLGNSADAFLLLRLSHAGVAPAIVAVLWSAHHVVKMIATAAGGRSCDRWGPKRGVVVGWVLYAAVYLAFGVVDSEWGLIALFLAYGLYFGAAEPAERAWVAALVPERMRGLGFGGYHGAVGLGALPASLLFGWLWSGYGVAFAFSVGAALALLAALMLLSVPESQPRADVSTAQTG